MEAALWGFLGTLVGAATSILTAWLSSRSSYQREHAKRLDERVEQAREFQRRTILNLQDAVHDLLRIAGSAHHQDFIASRSGQEWGQNMLPTELNDGAHVAFRKIGLLLSRVADDELRAKVKVLTGDVSRLLLARTELDSVSMLAKLTNQSEQLFEHMGVVLRGYYGPAQ